MKYFGSIFLLLLAAASSAQTKFSIKGKIQNQNDGILVLTYTGGDGEVKRDTSAISNGQFAFSGNISEPVMASLTGRVTSRGMDDPNFTNFFIEPGTINIKLKADDFKKIEVSGSKSQSEYAVLYKAKRAVENKYKIQLDSLRTEKDHEKNAAIRERLAPYFAEGDAEDYKFFSAHPTSYVTAYMMRFHVGDLTVDSLQMFYNRFGKQLQQSRFGKEVYEEIVKLRNGSPGSIATDFKSVDINGNKINLSDYRGKYVLLDFWASWCVPCRKGNPHLLSLYAKYKNKGFEIIGVSDDDGKPDAWQKAVEQDGIGVWKHVLRGLKRVDGPPYFDKSQSISDRFGIHTLPTKILINPQGLIVGRFGGGGESDDAMDKMLAEIFDKTVLD